MSQGSQQTRLFVTSNQRTPSTKTHINSLPPELLRHIFSCYCSIDYGPLPLLLVCRLWHAIASDYSALWGNICYNLNRYYFFSTLKTIASTIEMRENPIFCDTWAKFQWAVKRARTAPLNLHLRSVDTDELYKQQGSEISFLARCRELSLDGGTGDVAFLNDLSALEHLDVDQVDNAEVDQLLNDIEQRIPLLWSLKLRGMWTFTCLMHFSKISERIRCLDITFNPAEYGNWFIVGMRNLTELTFRSCRSLQIPRLAFPKLLSLTIWETRLEVDKNTEFPVLDHLTLHEDCSSLPLIVAPKLTKLILRCERATTSQTAILRRATVRPTSLVLSAAPLAIDLPELLTMWSGLLELHLEYYKEVNVMSQVQLATLGGNSDHGRLCPHLRYLTVHVNQGQRDLTMTGQIIRTLHTLVEERKRHETDELRRVMCVWENWPVFNLGYVDKSKEIEWVNVL